MNSERATAAEVDAGDCGVAHGFVFLHVAMLRLYLRE